MAKIINSNTAVTVARTEAAGGAGAAGTVMPPEGSYIESNWHESTESFGEIRLHAELLRGIYASGFEKPSAIQQRTIVPCIKGRDVIAQGQSGTNRTATFVVATLQRIDISNKLCQALILAPTPELATQIQAIVLSIGSYLGIGCRACINGTDMQSDIVKLREGVQVIVGTPRRVYDIIQRRALRTDQMKIFVLDEADEMLSRGFKDPIYNIFKYLKRNVQVVLLLDKMPHDVLEFTKNFMRDPISIQIKEEEKLNPEKEEKEEEDEEEGEEEEMTLEGIKQVYCDFVKDEWKFDTLCDICESITEALSMPQAIIFCNTVKVPGVKYPEKTSKLFKTGKNLNLGKSRDQSEFKF